MRAREFELKEKVNPESVEPGFKLEKWIINGRYRMEVKAKEPTPEGDVPGIIIHVYDPEKKGGLWNGRIATGRFIVMNSKTKDGTRNFDNATIEPSFVSVDDKYHRQGIASAMYNFIRLLGNDLNPSNAQSDMAKKFWAAGGGQGKATDYSDEPPATPEPKVVVAEPPKKKSFKDRLVGMFAEDFVDR
jgi:GNAT superfamily N-acetyltransferase